jgi:uncharacterized protein
MNHLHANPTSSDERVNQLDILRGFALLGILLMNIQSFSMPSSAYLNPLAWGDLENVNFIVWAVSNVFADSKFMGLFSILFGAGVCLFAEKAQQKQGSSAWLHYKRNLWLLVFGLVHAHFIWYGDILVSYALCAFWIYWFRNRSARMLIVFSIVFLSIASIYSLLVNFSLNNNFISAEGVREILSFWKPEPSQLKAEIAAYKGSMLEQFHQRSEEAWFLETQVFISTFLWRAGGMMLLGMALYKNGVLRGQKSIPFYWYLSLIGVAIGLSLSCYGVQQNLAHNFELNYSMFGGSQFNYWGSIFTTLGYIGLVNLAILNGFAKNIQDRLASVGQMAFSNYIFHSVFCTFIFYGFGLGLYAEVERISQLLIVIVVWTIQLYYSPLWLKYYRFGPLEWGWRSLTYWQPQPMRRD